MAASPTPHLTALNPVTPGGAGSGAGLVMIAGAIAFFGSMKEAKMFPSNGVRIIFATMILAVVISLFDHGSFQRPVKWLGFLMIISALIRYVPKFNTKKGK